MNKLVRSTQINARGALMNLVGAIGNFIGLMVYIIGSVVESVEAQYAGLGMVVLSFTLILVALGVVAYGLWVGRD